MAKHDDKVKSKGMSGDYIRESDTIDVDVPTRRVDFNADLPQDPIFGSFLLSMRTVLEDRHTMLIEAESRRKLAQMEWFETHRALEIVADSLGDLEADKAEQRLKREHERRIRLKKMNQEFAREEAEEQRAYRERDIAKFQREETRRQHAGESDDAHQVQMESEHAQMLELLNKLLYDFVDVIPAMQEMGVQHIAEGLTADWKRNLVEKGQWDERTAELIDEAREAFQEAASDMIKDKER